MTIVGLRCPACGRPATGRFNAGDWYLCRSCGAWSAAAGSDPQGALAPETIQLARQAWMLLTKNPQITRRQMAAQIGYTWPQCNHAIRVLQRLGYVEYRKNTRRAIRVLVPFGVQE